jgi:hypothetical protein
LLTRGKGRDLYDLWYLITLGIKINKDLVKEKLKYYHLEKITKDKILDRIRSFSSKDFVLDLRPFVPLNQRNKLEDFFDYLMDFLEERFG